MFPFMSQVLSNYSIFDFFLYREKDNGVLLVSRAAWLPCVRLVYSPIYII